MVSRISDPSTVPSSFHFFYPKLRGQDTPHKQRIDEFRSFSLEVDKGILTRDHELGANFLTGINVDATLYGIFGGGFPTFPLKYVHFLGWCRYNDFCLKWEKTSWQI